MSIIFMILYFVNNYALQSRKFVIREVEIDVYMNVNV